MADAIAQLLGEGGDEAFDRLTRLATMALRAPAAALSLMVEARLLIKSQVGLPEPWASDGGRPLPHAVFRHAAATSKPFIVEDCARHPLTKDMAIAPGWEHAAYCGIPLVLDGRRVIGVLSVFDRSARHWSEREVGFLQDLASSAVQEISERLEPVGPPAAPPHRAAAVWSQAAEPFFAIDADWNFTVVTPRAEKLLRRGADELLGVNLFTALPDLMGTPFHQECLRAFSEHSTVEFEDWCAPLDMWLETRAYPANGGLAVHIRDVSARRNAEEALRQSEARYRSVFQESRDPIVFTAEDGSITECNRATIDALGYAREELFRLRLRDLFADVAEAAELERELETTGHTRDMEAHLRTRDGGGLDSLVTVSARRGPEGDTVGYQAILRDNTLRKQTERELRHNAFHDPLTGLPNRALFIDRLDRTMVQAQRRVGYRFAVLFIDIDRFKLVNDTLGHMAGDELIGAVARRLESCLRQEDTVARFGGDEFAILLDGIHDVRDATLVADRINFELALPLRVGRREVACSASIGIALSASGYERGEDVLHDADAAMYRAKSNGRARYEVFDTEMHSRAMDQLRLEADLRVAVQEAQFDVNYMPVISLDDGVVVGVEALVRWNHPNRGVLQPAEFLTVAEQTGLNVEIGWAVMRQACEELGARPAGDDGAEAGPVIGFNLSARQFLQPDLVGHIDLLLAETGVDPRRLMIELSENVIMANAEQSTAVLGQLAARGIHICVDDFGTGYSSLRYLQSFPVHALKIDRSFVSGLEDDVADRGVVQSIIGLGRSLGIDTIAEGVETLEQLQALRVMGARFAQGYLFSEPLDVVRARELLRESAPV